MSDADSRYRHLYGRRVLGNPGAGGWGAILISGEHRKEIRGGEAHSTNNRMELMAAISRAGSAQETEQRRAAYRQPIREERHHAVDSRLEEKRLENS